MARAGFLASTALAVALTTGAAGFVLGLIMSVTHPEPIAGTALRQRQSAESAVYVLSWVVAMPLGVLVAWRLGDRLEARGRGTCARAAALALACLALALVAVRVSGRLGGPGGTSAWLVADLVWAVAAAVLVAVALRGGLPSWAPGARMAWGMAGLGSVATVLVVAHAYDGVGVLPVVLGVLGASGALWAFVGLRPLVPGRRAGLAVDVLALVLLALAIPDVVIMRPEATGLDFTTRYLQRVVAFHQDFLLGPANQVLHGTPLLVGASSQYGVGSIYLVAGWTALLGISHGTIGLLDGALTAGTFGAAYLVARMAGVGRLLAVATLAVAVCVLVLALQYPVGTIVQEGPIRFGVPMLALAVGVLAVRIAPARRGRVEAGLAVVAGLSAIWSLEALLYTTITIVALSLAEALVVDGPARRVLRRRLALVPTGWVAAHVLLALATLAASGHLPRWGEYLAFLHAFLLGGLGDITYDVLPWSPGLLVGAAELASAAALCLLLLRHRQIARHERVAVVALAGTTAYGACLFYYFVDRSAIHVLPYTCLPLVLSGLLWAGVALRAAGGARPPALVGAFAAVLVAGVVALVIAWPSLGGRLDRTALAHVVPGGTSLHDAIGRLRAFPPVEPGVPEAERLLRTAMPGEDRSLVLVAPGTDLEALMATDRANVLPIPYPYEDGFIGATKLPLVQRAIDGLRPGRRMLIDATTLGGLATAAGRTQAQLLHSNVPFALPVGLQVLALRAIVTRFDLRTVVQGASGLQVVELVPR